MNDLNLFINSLARVCRRLPGTILVSLAVIAFGGFYTPAPVSYTHLTLPTIYSV